MILYCDCFSGISGDMFLGALLDAGLPADYLSAQFRLLNLPEFGGLSAQKVRKGALAATLLKLEINNEEHQHDQDHAHKHDHPHDHDHPHEHNHDHSPAHQRGLVEIRTLIEASPLSDQVKQTSLKIFQKLAQAEAKVHGTSIEEVHFHEVGAVDSILDIVGAAVGLEYFDIQALFSSALPLGSGQIKTQHGLLPLPAPATLELLQMAGAPLRASPATKELVTPTGAAILTALAEFRQPELRLKRVGVGAGQRDLEWPNILRVLIGDSAQDSPTHLELETNIDDMNPQIFGQVMAKLFQAGALDVYFTPIFMKKNRPATKLSVILRAADEERISAVILRETTTLGVRVHPIRRHEAGREMRNLETRFGVVPVKLKILAGAAVQATPEFDACAALADQNGVPVAEVLQEVSALCRAVLG